jgi:acetyl/propionyl-CoA carboxylase alpha subunit
MLWCIVKHEAYERKKAEIGGKIVEVLVENGQPVEFGQTLFVLEAV